MLLSAVRHHFSFHMSVHVFSGLVLFIALLLDFGQCSMALCLSLYKCSILHCVLCCLSVCCLGLLIAVRSIFSLYMIVEFNLVSNVLYLSAAWFVSLL